MDMKNILQNFEDASAGKKPSTGAASSNEMKKILESFNNVTECGMQEMPAQPEPDKVNMNVNISAQGEEGIEQLIKIMAGAQHVSGHTSDMQMEPEMGGMDVEMPSKSQEMDMATLRQIMAASEEKEMEDDVEEEWDNAPDEEYKDHHTMTKDLSGGINRQKKAYAAAQDGDNAMAVEALIAELSKSLREKMDPVGKEDGDINNDGEEDETDEYLQKRRDAIAKNTKESTVSEDDDDPCWDDYEMIGMKKKGGKEVPNCVPKKK